MINLITCVFFIFTDIVDHVLLVISQYLEITCLYILYLLNFELIPVVGAYKCSFICALYIQMNIALDILNFMLLYVFDTI